LKTWQFDLLLRAGRTKTFRLLPEVTLFENKPEQVLFKNCKAGWIYRREPILIDYHGLTLDPLTPALGRDIFIDALSEFAWIWHPFQPGRFVTQNDTVHYS
jgi:hypothetical protein